MVAGQTSAQATRVLEYATGLLETGWSVRYSKVALCTRAECRRGKAPGEPYEGKPHVRFDEGVLETGLWNRLRHRRCGESRRPTGYSLFLSLPRQRPTLQIRNVAAKLPEDLADQVRSVMKAAFHYLADPVRSVMKAAFRLPWKEGIAKLRKQAEWLRPHYPDAAASLEEGLDELFTINRLELSSSLRLCLGTTNIIDSFHSGIRIRTRRVGRWRNGQMVLRWAASGTCQQV